MLSYTAAEISHVERACDTISRALLQQPSGGDEIPYPLQIEACGSFPVRTSVGLRGGVYCADVALEIPEALCSTADVEAGRYLDIRRQVLRVAAARLRKNLPATTTATTTVELVTDPATPLGEKQLIRVAFSPRCIVQIHARPRHAGSVNSAKGIRKKSQLNGRYGALVVEDLVMVRTARAVADAVSRCPALAVAAQLLRKWAAHTGIVPPQDDVAASSLARALSGGLNHFAVVTAPLLLLWHDGTIAAASATVDSIVRAVWVFWTQRFGGTQQQSMPAVLHLPSEPHLNVLHHVTSPDALAAVVDAAQSALTGGSSVETLLSQLPGRSLYERFDAIIRIADNHHQQQQQEQHDNNSNDAILQRQEALTAALKTGLAARASAVVVGCTATATQSAVNNNNKNNSSTMYIVGVTFVSESAARSRLFRGPTIDDAAACAAFDKLWGTQNVSTRQFGDGSIAKCVLLDPPAMMTTSNTGSSNNNNYYSEFSDPAAGHRSVCDAVQVLASRVFGSSGTIAAVELCGGCEMQATLWTTDAARSVARDPEPFVARARAAAVEDMREHLNIVAESSLPCKVTGIEFVSPAERGTDPLPPLPHAAVRLLAQQQAADAAAAATSFASPLLSTAATISPIQIVVQIEDRKHRVPDNVDAISTMKSVVLAQIATELAGVAEKYQELQRQQQQGSGKKGGGSGRQRMTPAAAVAAANNSTLTLASGGSKLTVHCSKTFADVLHEPSGFVFRIVVLLERELLVLQQVGRAAEAAAMSRVMVWGQRHAEYMRGLIAQHPCVAGACRLLRRWVCAMCLGDYVPIEVTELVVAHCINALITSPATAAATSSFFNSAHTLFLAALRVIGYFPFNSEPLMVQQSNTTNSNSNADASGGSDYDRAAIAWREQRQQEEQGNSGGNAPIPSVARRAMFIVAPYTESDHSPFTEATPRRGVFGCLQEAARAAWETFARGMAASGSAVGFEAAAKAVFTLDTERCFTFALPLTDSAAAAFAPNTVVFANNNSSNSNDQHQQGSGIARRLLPSLSALPDERAKELLSRAIDHSALSATVKGVRRQFRDRCMIFYDELAPSHIAGIEFGAAPAAAARPSSASTVAHDIAQRNSDVLVDVRLLAVAVEEDEGGRNSKGTATASAAVAGKKRKRNQQQQKQQPPPRVNPVGLAATKKRAFDKVAAQQKNNATRQQPQQQKTQQRLPQADSNKKKMLQRKVKRE